MDGYLSLSLSLSLYIYIYICMYIYISQALSGEVPIYVSSYSRISSDLMRRYIYLSRAIILLYISRHTRASSAHFLLYTSSYISSALILLYISYLAAYLATTSSYTLATTSAYLATTSSYTLPPIYRAPSFFYIFLSILLYMCPHIVIYVSSYYYICVLILCPHTAVYVSSYTAVNRRAGAAGVEPRRTAFSHRLALA
jgi:hypothetical protein